MASDSWIFPFGRPVEPYKREDNSKKSVFVLGAYPSVLHVAWRSADGARSISALPVDNEPEPFWNGDGELPRIEAWKTAVQFDESRDGTVKAVGALNGSSGIALDQRYFQPLGIKRSDTWIADCLPLYCASAGVAKAIDARFVPGTSGSARPAPHLPPHPSESRIAADGRSPSRLEELRAELAAADPERVITLGNAAAKVFRAMAGTDLGPTTLKAIGYGSPVELPALGVRWYPLAHPGVIRRPTWSETHDSWASSAV